MAPPPTSLPPSSMARLRAKADIAKGLLTPQRAYLWGLGLGSFALGLVNGALVISTGIGVLAYRHLAQLSPDQQHALRQRIQGAVPLPRSLGQQALLLSLLLGASTYTVTALWQNTHSLLMALVLTGQTALTFFLVVALLRSPPDHPADHPTKRAEVDATPGVDPSIPATASTLETPVVPSSPRVTPSVTEADRFEQGLTHLAQADPLQRLIAVRQLVRLVHQVSAESTYIAGAEVSMQSHLIDCFHVLLAHESEPIVRSAVREGLALLRQPPPGNQLPAGADPLPEMAWTEPDPWAEAQTTGTVRGIPAAPHSAASPSVRRTVDYVEYLDI